MSFSSSEQERRGSSISIDGTPSYNTNIRHGFNTISEELMSELAEGYFNYFTDKRHECQGLPQSDESGGGDWRVADRQRTVNAALVMCLNLGVDPPDIIKTQPAARIEAWVDPQQYGDSKKALEQIGKNLQSQYEILSTRTKFKQVLDPIIDDIKRFCLGLRRSARDDRILFHYNGHGVPRPTPSGEIWMFNRGYTQYIPVSVYELQSWLGSPVIYCYDCSGAGNIVRSFDDFVQKRKEVYNEELQSNGGFDTAHQAMPGSGYSAPYNPQLYDTCIQLGACQADEILPMNPALPADLFTCCITTPVDIAIRWFLIQNSHSFASPDVDPSNIKIPGKITDRRTPLGELNWIFTAITDTIAWSVLDQKLFKRLFRQDLIVATLFRNFLLACRIMRTHNCHPVSSPELPVTYNHPLWDSWDAAVNQCLLQVTTPSPNSDGLLFSDFFEQQLTAFELWLDYQRDDVENPPDQLPILLQVLLSQIHRVRALTLLCRYLDLGPPAVRIALSIGFFIYVLKLLQSPSPELQPVLVFIWARTLAVYGSDVDRSVQLDLMKEGGYMYFVKILLDSKIGEEPESSESNAKSRNLAMCCFVLSQISHGYPNAKSLLISNEDFLEVLEKCTEAKSPLLRQWSIILLSEITPPRSVSTMLWRLKDPIPEIRCAVVYAMTSYLKVGHLSESDTDMIGKATVSVALDGSPMVRHELVVFLSQFIRMNESKFIVCAFTTLEEEFAASKYGGDMRSESPAHGTVSLALWRCLLVLTNDAMPYVKKASSLIVDSIQTKLMRTNLGEEVRQMMSVLLEPSELRKINGGADINYSLNALLDNAEQHLNEQSRHHNHHHNDLSVGNSTQPGHMFTHGSSNSSPGLLSWLDGGDKPKGLTGTLLKGAVNWILGADAANSAPVGSPVKPALRNRASLASLGSLPRNNSDDHNGAMNGTVSSSNVINGTNSSNSNGSTGSGSPNLGATKKDSNPTDTPGSLSVKVETENDPDNVILVSSFRDFSVEYFREPQLKPSESEEPGSKQYYERLWRKSRNEKIMAETQGQKNLAVNGTWTNHFSSINGSGEAAKKLAFAQYEPHLISAGTCDVSVFDWQRNELLNKFHAGNELADVQYLNEDDNPLLLTASRDGIARVYKNYASPDACQIVSSWWLFADLVHHQPHNPSLHIDWLQSRGHLLVGGDARVVRVWDLAREQTVCDIPVRTSSQLTSLTSDKVAGNLVFSGFSDGSVHVYDRRIDKQQALVRRWKPVSAASHDRIGHSSRILSLQMQRGGTREVVSGSADGQICLWDVRSSEAVGGFRAHTKELRCMDLHEHAPVIATASRITGIWCTSGRRISTLKGPSSSYLSSRISPVGTLKFHPHQMILAMGDSEDASINLFKCVN